MPSKFSHGARRLPLQLCVGLLSNITCLLVVVLLTASRAHAQGAAASGAERWDRLGCWNCHGREGDGARLGRPALIKSPLPLRRFIGRTRLPVGAMPPHAPWLAPDADLAIIYRWLNGIDVVSASQAITIDLKSSPPVKADGQAEAQVEIEMTALRARTALETDVRDLAALHYRVTVITNSNLPVANRTLEYRSAGLEDWSKFTMNEDGEALLDQDRRFVVAKERDPGKARARLRMTLPTVRTLVVVEALDYTQPAKPVVVGIGTAILKPLVSSPALETPGK